MGAAFGTGYCDAQCPHDVKYINGEPNSQVKMTIMFMMTMMSSSSSSSLKDWIPSETDANAGFGHFGSCCYELDIWEANEISTVTIAVILSSYHNDQHHHRHRRRHHDHNRCSHPTRAKQLVRNGAKGHLVAITSLVKGAHIFYEW